jgi:predicted ABC-type ATPase
MNIKSEEMTNASVKDVVDKITKRIRDNTLVQRLTEKVLRFIKTRNPSDDLTPSEVSSIYRQDDYGADYDMPGGHELDVGWTNHAEYRSDLRSVDPSKVNKAIRDFAETHPNRRQKVNLTNHSIGKAVVDLDTTVNPSSADVITVIASQEDESDIESSLLISSLSELGVVGLSKVAGPNDIRWQAVFMMGSSGSGKSHYREKTYLKYMKFKVVDPDAFVMAHPDYDPERPYLLHEWSKDVSDAEFNSIISDGTGDPVVVDGTGRNPEGILRKMTAAKKNGYRIFLVYVWVPVEVSIWRNRNRSRFVPEDKIMNVYKGYDSSFAKLRGYADSFKVIPNYTSEDLRDAKKDLEVYPAPQKVRPPRP